MSLVQVNRTHRASLLVSEQLESPDEHSNQAGGGFWLPVNNQPAGEPARGHPASA